MDGHYPGRLPPGGQGALLNGPPPPVLLPRDPSPVGAIRESGRAPILLIGDHAGNAIPASLDDLGVSAQDRARHIAWDLGIRALGEELATLLDATFIHQRFSRLVIDCNRDPGSSGSIVEASDGTPVPGNTGLDARAREDRRIAIHEPYHARIASELAQRRVGGARPVLVALHSFTPSLGGRAPRPWQLGVLHDKGDTTLSRAFLARLRREPYLTVGDNEPYKMDGTDYTIPRHAYPGDAPYLEIEFRQDLLSTPEGVHVWGRRFAGWLSASTALL